MTHCSGRGSAKRTTYSYRGRISNPLEAARSYKIILIPRNYFILSVTPILNDQFTCFSSWLMAYTMSRQAYTLIRRQHSPLPEMSVISIVLGYHRCRSRKIPNFRWRATWVKVSCLMGDINLLRQYYAHPVGIILLNNDN